MDYYSYLCKRKLITIKTKKMGRYYSGDIDGKFWFAVQSSSAADRFGVVGYQPERLAYYFSSEGLEGVETEIKNIETKLGDKLEVIKKFFANHNGYNDTMLKEAEITKEDLKEYADLCLGIEIRDCIKEKGQCEFEAEM
jgi:hypothetical protein